MIPVIKELPDVASSWARYTLALTRALNRERAEFTDSTLIAAQVAMEAAKDNPLSLMETLEVLEHTRELTTKAATASHGKITDHMLDTAEEAMGAFFNTLFNTEGEKLTDFMRREAEIMEGVANFNEEIEKIKDEFGFQFLSSGYKLFHETDTFEVYQVLPTKKGVKVNDGLKPMLLIPPYMLGVHILSFLPGEDKSYAHSFANEGIPTYVRVTKDIMENETVQMTTPDGDCTQTKEISAKLKKKHGQKVTLNGTCQGGYIALMNILSGTMKNEVDTLITNVAPIDGTLSPSISGMPQMHHDFMTTTLANGNQVANGYLLSLGMRFVAIDRENPLVKVLDQISLHKATNSNPGKTVAALFRWLLKERTHLPLAIAQMSSATFRQPISETGDLPVQLYGKALNVKDLDKLGIKWYQDYAAKDDLVTPLCATAANRFLEGTDVIEEVEFPGGHVAILTSPYNKRSPVNDYFTTKDGKKHRGPVKFQLEISEKKTASAEKKA